MTPRDPVDRLALDAAALDHVLQRDRIADLESLVGSYRVITAMAFERLHLLTKQRDTGRRLNRELRAENQRLKLEAARRSLSENDSDGSNTGIPADMSGQIYSSGVDDPAIFSPEGGDVVTY